MQNTIKLHWYTVLFTPLVRKTINVNVGIKCEKEINFRNKQVSDTENRT